MIQKNKKYTVTGEYLAELTAEPCIVKRINKLNGIVDDPLQGNWKLDQEQVDKWHEEGPLWAEEWHTGPLDKFDTTFDTDCVTARYWRNR